MNENNINKVLEEACLRWAGKHPDQLAKLPLSGSVRKYFRIRVSGTTIIGVYSDNPAENRAFLSFTKHFRDKGLNVPEILFEDLNNNVYLLEDLGDILLYDEVISRKKDTPIPGRLKRLYQKTLDHLVRFQVDGFDGLDLSVCVPRPAFDKQSVMWDLHYFKYYVLKLFNIPFDEQALEDEFNKLADYLTDQEYNFFLYRDFQSRNILVHKEDLYFVDYQGGRRGPLQYDLASILFEAKTDLPPEVREELLDYYTGLISSRLQINGELFKGDYYHFVFVRILQALAAYGLRGYVENKALFLESYPYALRNLEWLLSANLLSLSLPETLGSLRKVLELKELRGYSRDESKLQISINSFSYKKGIPKDMSGHGGGFVFDCRALPNPYRSEDLRNLTGRDDPVIQFMDDKVEVNDFMEHVCSVIGQAVSNYRSRGFNSLMVSFGCTGGQHRSVYCADRLARFIWKKHGVETQVVHRELS